ncbi:hypothetical protein SeLEV6574_g00955 [Synchytrium endobioticum]|nr:hypothetical protein SeLEV6574_g00955 [Synchytrium endobioticum]
MSTVFYKFKAAKEYDTATFDGFGISVFDLKREIMIAKKLGKGDNFDLVLFNAQTNEEYADDTAMIPRNTSILVARQPALKPGRGTAQRYVGGAAPLLASSHHPGGGGSRHRGGGRYHPYGAPQNSEQPNSGTAEPAKPLEEMTEEERTEAMFKQSGEAWIQEMERMEQVTPIGRPSHRRQADSNAAFAPPPPGYICYRCGQKGHWISQCPTKEDKTFDRPKLKRTTGIPRMFLQTVQARDGATTGDGGVMITQNGEFVVAKPNEQEWQKTMARSKNYLGMGDIYEQAPVPDDLKCPIDAKLLREAVDAPCCGSHFCDECIRNSLLENPDPVLHYRCPICKKDLFPDDLVENSTLRSKVERHLHTFAITLRAGSPAVPGESTPQPSDVVMNDSSSSGSSNGNTSILNKTNTPPVSAVANLPTSLPVPTGAPIPSMYTAPPIPGLSAPPNYSSFPNPLFAPPPPAFHLLDQATIMAQAKATAQSTHAPPAPTVPIPLPKRERAYKIVEPVGGNVKKGDVEGKEEGEASRDTPPGSAPRPSMTLPLPQNGAPPPLYRTVPSIPIPPQQRPPAMVNGQQQQPYRPYNVVPQQAPQTFPPMQNRPYIPPGQSPYHPPPYTVPQQAPRSYIVPQQPVYNAQQQFGALYHQQQQINRPGMMTYPQPQVQQIPQVNRLGNGGKQLIAGPLGKDGKPLFMRATPELQADWEAQLSRGKRPL